MNTRPIAVVALVTVIASLAGCAVEPGQGPGMFGAMTKAAAPPQQAPQQPMMRAPAPAPQPTASVADATLQRDVMKMIGGYEGAAGGSKTPTLVAARGTGKAGATYVERWSVNSDGALIDYEVRLTPAAGGGVDYKVTRITK